MGRNQPKRKSYPALGAILALGMLASTGNANTDGIEKWECGITSNITLIADFNTGMGKVKLGNMKAEIAQTSIKGLNRRWDWGNKEDDYAGFAYALIIESGHTGLYYDFSESERASPSDRFTCSQFELGQSELEPLKKERELKQAREQKIRETLSYECSNALETGLDKLEKLGGVQKICTEAELEKIGEIMAEMLIERTRHLSNE